MSNASENESARIEVVAPPRLGESCDPLVELVFRTNEQGRIFADRYMRLNL